MSQDKKQAVAAGDFDPARDIMFKLQDFWFKYKNVVIVVAVLVVAGLVFYVNKQNAENAKTEAASTAFSLAMNTVSKDTVKGIEMLSAVYDEHQGTLYARYGAYGAAQLYLAQGNAEKALQWFDMALAVKGNDIIIDAEAKEGKAIALELQGKIDEAKSAYEAVLAMKSHRTKDVSLKLAYLEMKNGNSAAAEKYCENIIADSLNVTSTTFNAQALLAEIKATK